MNNQQTTQFVDSLRLAKDFNVEQLVLCHTNLDEYFRSSTVPDNQKVLIALLSIKKRFKKLTVSNSFVAKFLNSKGIYHEEYEEVEEADELTGVIEKRRKCVKKDVIYSVKLENGNEQPLYTTTGVSDAINKWEKEGILILDYDYEFNKKMDQPYKFNTTRTIRFNYDKLKPLLACSLLSSTVYTSLAKRSRLKKLVRSKPMAILDFLKDEFNAMSEEQKKQYSTANGIFLDFCWRISSKYFKVNLKYKPNASYTEMERYMRSQEALLKRCLEPSPGSGPIIEPTHNGNLIKLAFDSMKKN